mgnify:CR=1 FL=1
MNDVLHESISNSFYSIEVFSVLGTNTEQEDAVGYVVKDTSAVLVICDGMGGMNGGRISAQTAVQKVKELAKNEEWESRPLYFIKKALEIADEEVYYLKNNKGERICGGCTIVIGIIIGRRLYYANVGDSRIYYFNGKVLNKITQDHNYGEELKRKLKRGEIGDDEYNKEQGKAAALTGFLGLGELREYYICETPLLLEQNQIVCLQSDGLYRLLAEQEMQDIFVDNLKNLEHAGEVLLQRAEENKRRYQDNTSIVLVRLK